MDTVNRVSLHRNDDAAEAFAHAIPDAERSLSDMMTAIGLLSESVREDTLPEIRSALEAALNKAAFITRCRKAVYDKKNPREFNAGTPDEAVLKLIEAKRKGVKA